MRKILIVAIVAMAVALAWLLFLWQPPREQNLTEKYVADAPVGGDFILQSVDGPVRLSDLRGKVAILYFGYTWCPDVCPTSLGYLTAALEALTEQELADVQGVFISVDPARDSVQRLADYVAFFHSSLVGVTGSEQELAQVARSYGAAYKVADQQQTEMGYVVDHTSELFLIDKNGALVEKLPHGTAPEKILSSIRKLLEQR